MSLIDKLSKNSTIKLASVITKSKIYNKSTMTSTSVMAINIALSGELTGGFGSGITLWCGPSKHFKTLFSLIQAKAYLDKYPEAVLLFYDSEFGLPESYFRSLGIDMDRVFHVPITNIEELKFDIMQQLKNIERGDKVIIMIDSLGNLASKKEVDDAEDGKSVADMTRAKQLKSLFRMITPHLTIKDLHLIGVNHTYQTQEMFSKAVVSGGTGLYYSADNIFIIGRQQEKDSEGISGYNFIINVEKSRHSKEKSKIPVQVRFSGGVNPFSAIKDIAMEGNFIAKPKNGWYAKVDRETGEIEPKNYREKDLDNTAFWGPILKLKEFQDFVRTKYKVSTQTLLTDEEEDISEDIVEDGLEETTE